MLFLLPRYLPWFACWVFGELYAVPELIARGAWLPAREQVTWRLRVLLGFYIALEMVYLLCKLGTKLVPPYVPPAFAPYVDN